MNLYNTDPRQQTTPSSICHPLISRHLLPCMSAPTESSPAVQALKKVGVVGAGVIGASWAALYLSKGLDVVVVDPSPKAVELVDSMLQGATEAYASAGLGSRFQYSRSQLHSVSSDYATLQDVDFVQESGPERLDTKAAVYERIEAHVRSDVIIASSSSGIVPTALQQGTAHPERILLAHPFNPPHIVPLVEIVAGAQTDPKYVQLAYDFFKALGKSPILIRKEVKGHVANRLQAAIAQEVFHLLQEGVANLEDLDTALSQGPGLRWGIYGQFLNFEFGGGAGGIQHMIDHLGPHFLDWAHDLGRVNEISPDLRNQVVQELDAFHRQTNTTPAQLAAVRDRILIQTIEKKNEENINF